MNALVDKAIAAIAKLSDAEQEAIARDLLARIEADGRHRQVKTVVRAWLDDVQSHFADIEIAPREQPPMPPSHVNLDG